MHLAMHFGTILSQSTRPTRPTSEVNILELISQFKAHYICQHTDFDMRTHSFGPVMTVFREYVEGRSQSGGEAIFEQKVEDMSTVQPTATAARKQSKYSGFWQDRATDRGAKSGTPGQSPLGHEYVGEKKLGKKAKVDRKNLGQAQSPSPGPATLEGYNVFSDVDFEAEKESNSPQQSLSAQAFIGGGSQSLSFMPTDSSSY